MLSDAPAYGLDLLTRMAASAAERASAQLSGAIRLAGCDSFALTGGSAAGDIDLESWAVNGDRQKVVISVFATAAQENGGRRMAGSGRFTFITSPAEGRRLA